MSRTITYGIVSATAAGVSLCGLELLGPLHQGTASPRFPLAALLLAVFWLAYLCGLMTVLLWLARQLFAHQSAPRDASAARRAARPGAPGD